MATSHKLNSRLDGLWCKHWCKPASCSRLMFSDPTFNSQSSPTAQAKEVCEETQDFAQKEGQAVGVPRSSGIGLDGRILSPSLGPLEVFGKGKAFGPRT